MQRNALPGEAQIALWGGFTLTSHRVWVVKAKDGQSVLQSMPIDAVQSVGIETQHFPILLLLTALFVLGAIIAGVMESGGTGPAILSFVMAVVCVVIYVLTRKVAVAIHAGSAVISTGIDGSKANLDAAMRFLDAVEGQGLAVRQASDPNMGRTSATFATAQSR
jgi:hypothetical protein